ncbi:hypothetical protein AAG906_038160 [Vitis piasezkii]
MNVRKEVEQICVLWQGIRSGKFSVDSMEDLSSNSLSDFADDWVMDQPEEKETAVDQSLPEVVTFPAGDIASPAVVVTEEVFGDGDKAAEEVGEGELEEVVVVEEAVPKRRRRRRTGKRKAVEKSEVPTSPAEVLQRRSRGRQRRAGRAEVSPPFGTVKGRLNAYILTVNIGEDVVNQILSFSKFGPQAICTILSATGIVSSVTISQPSHPGELESFEGRFEIISLSGSFTAGEMIGGPEDGGMLNILLGNSDGGVFGGGLAGSLIAASPIQLVCGGLEKKQTHRGPKRRRGAKSSVAAILKPMLNRQMGTRAQ